MEHTYAPDPSGVYYRRQIRLHLANESDEPVFRVEVRCGIETERGTIRVGPLSAPSIIPVLPPRREFVYDVTMGMLAFGDFAHDSFRGLVSEVAFRDHEGKRWERDYSGNLQTVKEPKPAAVNEAGSELEYAQAGPVDSPYNPRGLILQFANIAADQSVSNQQFQELLVEHDPGWSKTPISEILGIREQLSNFNLALHVWYPTPRVAYARMLEDIDGLSREPRIMIITLVWRNQIGWRFFGIGPYLPWTIQFSPGELNADPLDGR